MTNSMKDFFNKHNNLPWLEKNTILLVRHGSHAYGTNTATSDEDYKGVCVPPLDYFIGFNKHFEQAESKEPDAVVYDIRKFFKLCTDNNPNILEVIWVDDSDILQLSETGKLIRDNRELFLSKKVKHTFSGYAAAQLKRMRAHHRWLVNPPERPPTREEFGLPETTLIPKDQLQAAWARVQKKIDSWQMDLSFLDPATIQQIESEVHRVLDDQELAGDPQWIRAAKMVDIGDNLIVVMDRERKYDAAKKEWNNYQTWMQTRNPERAKLEAKFGYDTKHGYHLVRLMRMCREILEGKGVIVKRPDAAELLEIRNGSWDYEKMVTWAEAEDKALEEVAKNSSLPWAPDREKIDNLCQCIVTMELLD